MKTKFFIVFILMSVFIKIPESGAKEKYYKIYSTNFAQIIKKEKTNQEVVYNITTIIVGNVKYKKSIFRYLYYTKLNFICKNNGKTFLSSGGVLTIKKITKKSFNFNRKNKVIIINKCKEKLKKNGDWISNTKIFIK